MQTGRILGKYQVFSLLLPEYIILNYQEGASNIASGCHHDSFHAGDNSYLPVQQEDTDTYCASGHYRAVGISPNRYSHRKIGV